MTYPSDSARNKALKDQINAISAKPAAPVGAADMPAYEVAVAEWRKSMTAINQGLLAGIPELGTSYKAMASKLNVLPPSGAMAGIYTHIDTTRGVWNAPANMSMSSVIGPTIKLTSSMQEDLNVPIDSKAVNVIRDFVGRGTLVWGARTMDGNSYDWRYIQVRRAVIYIEQSVKRALDKFVSAPNNGQTWTTVNAMISSFLRGVWSQGGLMGAKPDEAFKVRCGLDSTMTGLDILNGYMVVQISLQMIRPAEFIELTFKQTMQGAGQGAG
jgi:phage tail sheath protein FI